MSDMLPYSSPLVKNTIMVHGMLRNGFVTEKLPRDRAIVCDSHVINFSNAGNMAAVQEPLRNGDVANFQLEQMDQENISIIKEEVTMSTRKNSIHKISQIRRKQLNKCKILKKFLLFLSK